MGETCVHDYTCLCCDDVEPKYLENKKHCKSTRIMNGNWLFVAVGMHYVQKKLIRENYNLLLNCGYFSLFSKVYHLLDSMLAINFYVNLKTEVPKSC